MGNPYRQVLRMYWLRGTRSKSVFVVLIVCFIAAVMTSIVLIHNGNSNESIAPAFISMFVLFQPFQWFGFLQEQLLNEPRTLMPGFVAPHVTVFCGIIAIIGLGFPAVLIYFGASAAIWFMAYVMASFAVTALYCATGNSIFVIMSFLSYILMFLAAFSDSMTNIVRGLSAVWPVGVTVASCGVFGYCVWRMTRLTEEDQAYHVRLTVKRPAQLRMTGETNQRTLRSKQKRFRQPVFISPNAGFFARIRRWRSVTPHGWGIHTIVISTMAFMVAMVDYVHLTNAFSMRFVLLILSLLPAASANLVLSNIRQHLAEESLRPNKRATLVAELGAVIAIHSVDIWFTCAMVILISGLSGLLPLNSSMANDLIASFGVLWLNYGLVAWISKYRSSPNFAFVFMIWAFVTSEIVVDTVTNTFWAYAIVIGSILIGTLISLNAYQDWQNLEFGR